MRTPHPVLEVTGEDPESLQINLTTAVDQACTAAMRLGDHGIMVTQHNFSFFTVRLSPEVPYGQTWERREFSGTGADSVPARTDETGHRSVAFDR